MLSTLAEARASLLANSKRQAPTTLADQWTAWADQHLRIDCSASEVTRKKRDWYFERLQELRSQTPSPQRDALIAECMGFASTIGRVA